MDWAPLLFLGISAFFVECHAMYGLSQMFGNPAMMAAGQAMASAYQQKYPQKNCELIDNPGVPYPLNEAGDYGSNLLSLNSYVCADNVYAEPYYKTESVMQLQYNSIGQNMLTPEQHPGIETSFGFQQGGFVLSRAKYYDLEKKQFNIYTGKYVKNARPNHGSRVPVTEPPKRMEVPIVDKGSRKASMKASSNGKRVEVNKEVKNAGDGQRKKRRRRKKDA